MPSSKKRPSPSEWLQANKPRRGGSPCWFCERPKVLAAIEEFMTAEDRPPLRHILRYLQRFMECPRGPTSFLNHMENHRGNA